MNYEVLQPTEEILVAQAVAVVNGFYLQNLMLEAQMEQYQQLADQGRLAVIQNENGEVVATAGYTMTYPGDVWEFGGWAVKDGYQNQGLGKVVMEHLFAQNPHGKVIAFGNKNSGPIFEKLGAVVVEGGFGLPEEVYGPCATCPVKPALGCCDTIYHLGPVVAKVLERQKNNPNQIKDMIGWDQKPHEW